jgi:GIY-YIG catalytic domain
MIRCAKQDALRSFSEGGPVYYVYLIESLSAQEERYVGMTTDLKQRFREYNQGKSSHTTKFRPWTLISYIAFTNRARQKLSSVISNPVHVMHSPESAYGNSPSKVFQSRML